MAESPAPFVAHGRDLKARGLRSFREERVKKARFGSRLHV